MNERQKRFALEYVLDLNATQAAIRAGYSAATAASQGERLLRNVEISALVGKVCSRRETKTGINAERVLEEMARIAFGDIRKVFDENGNLRPIHELDDDTAAALAAVEVVARPAGKDEQGNVEIEYVHKIKAWDKPKALEMLARHLSLFNDKLDINVTHTLVNRLDEATKRLEDQRGKIKLVS